MRLFATVVVSMLFYIALTPNDASAHVLITDQSHQKGAILHITPDDDPIAGEQAQLFFDMQDQDIGNKVLLQISNGNGTDAITAQIQDTLAVFSYTFPTQGVYQLKFTTSGSTPYTFNYSQRISRGMANSSNIAQSHQWAEALLIISGLTIVVLIIIVLNRWSDIRKHSTL